MQDVPLRTVGGGKILPNFSSITIKNCSRVHVSSRTFEELSGLRQITLTNIIKLSLEEHSFSWPYYDELHPHLGIMINITNVTIPEIPSYTFRGSIQTIILQDVKVTNIRAFAFATLDHMDKIEFINSEFSTIEPQSFKKFSMNSFIVTGSRFPYLPTRTMVDVEIHHEARFQNVKFELMQNSALRIHGPQYFRLINCYAGRIDTAAFHIHMRGAVSIHDNNFCSLGTGAFSGFTVERRYLQESGRQELSFENNTLSSFDPSPLIFNTSGFDPRIYKITINHPCSCPETTIWLSELIFYSPESNVRSTPPGVAGIIYCQHTAKMISIQNFQKLYCGSKVTSVYVIIVLVIGTMVTVSIVGIIIFFGYRKTAKRYINVPTSPSAKKLADPGKGHMMVVPEGRTYRETELHVIVEHAEPITPTEYVGPFSDLTNK